MHEEFDDLCLLYSSGELPPEEAARFEAHRAGCRKCEEMLKALGDASRYAKAAAVSLPARRAGELAERVVRETDAAAAGRDWGWMPAFRRAWGACAVAAALAVGVYVSSPGRYATHELAWTNGIESDMVMLDDNLDSLDEAITLGESEAELEADFDELDELTDWIDDDISDV